MKNNTKAHVFSIILGIILILIGLIIPIPGGALTTYKSLDGESTDYYTFDNRYSSIDEYVGGDAYNYIIGSSLVSGRISGTITAKAICVVGGSICLCLGLMLKSLQEKNTTTETFKSVNISNNKESEQEPQLQA